MERRAISLLDRLVGGAIVADADRVMGKDIDDRNLHERAEADRRLHIVGENEEARAVGADLRQGEPIQDRAHGVLADSEMKISPARIVAFHVARALKGQACLGRGGEVSRASNQPGIVRRNRVEDLARRVAAGQSLGIRRENREIRIPAVRRLALGHALDLVGKIGMDVPIRFQQ